MMTFGWKSLVCVVFALVFGAACHRSTPQAQRPDTTVTVSTGDAAQTEMARAEGDSFAAVRDTIQLLETSLAGKSDSVAAQTYLTLAHLRLRLANWTFPSDPARAYAKEHPANFYFSDFSDSYWYNGGDFDTVVARYRGQPEADEAAWERANLDGPGECEGDFSCSVGRDLRPALAYLPLYPKGRYAAAMLMGALARLRDDCDRVPDLRTPDTVGTSSYAPGQLVSALNELDGVAARVMDSLRVQETDLSAALRRRAGDTPHALRLYRWLLDSAGPYPGRAAAQAVFDSLSRVKP